MLRQLLSLAALCAAFGASAQTTILDFEAAETSTTFQFFGSSLENTLSQTVANPNPTGVNTSDSVCLHPVPANSQNFAGAFSNPNPTRPIDVTTATLVCMDVHMPAAGTVTAKFEEGRNGAPNWEQTADVSTGGAWERVCFNTLDASGAAPNQVGAGQVYDKLVVFFNLGTTSMDSLTYYFDNVATEMGSNEDQDVTFAVDMSEYAESFNTVYVSGTFNGWSGTANPLSDDDLDGVWTTTLPLAAGQIEYKFTIDDWTVQEEFDGGEDCTLTTGGFTNRVLTVGGSPIALDTVCFGSCFACGEEISITINVGTSNISLSPDGIFLAGGGTFGNPGDFPMNDDDANGIYSITIKKQRGFESFYTFTNGNCPDYSCKENITGQSCAAGQFNDRFVGPVTQDTVINTCFGICTDDSDMCGASAADGMIAFSVNMNDYTEMFDVVYLAGSFAGWAPDQLAMSDDDGDGVWEGTFMIPGGRHEYKFVAGDTFEELAEGSSCTVTSGGFTNRLLDVDGDAARESVCFGSCADCSVGVDDLADLGVAFSVAPSVTADVAQLSFGTALDAATVRLYDVTGALLSTVQLAGVSNYTLDVQDVPAGLYYVQLSYAGAQGTAKLVKQ